MLLNEQQITATISQLNKVLAEQNRILNESKKIVTNDLAVAWEGAAQKAYSEAFVHLETRVLSQINSLIELFNKALIETQKTLKAVDVDLATMNIK